MAIVVAYRMTPRSIGYGIAAVAAASILAGAVGGLGRSRGAGGDLLFAALVVLGVAAPVALVAWIRGLEVRVCDAGIMSIGLSTVQMIRWRDLEHFEVDRYRSSPFVVYAVLADGSRVALEALRGGSSQRERVEQLRHALETRLVSERTRRADDAQAPAAWPPVPFGWRRRAHHIETQPH
jgi:hypothetical protein